MNCRGKSNFDYRFTYTALLKTRYYSRNRIVIESVEDPAQALGHLGTNEKRASPLFRLRQDLD